jgi:hypothetical protein
VSGVIRPAGPLPARVYWVRRALLLVLLVVVFSLIWWGAASVFGGGGSDARGSTSSSAGGSGGSGDGGSTVGGASQQGGGADKQRPGKHRHDGGKPTRHRPAAPSGPCAPTDVDIAVVVHDVAAGHHAPVALRLTSGGAAACTLAITPDTLALRITSGSDVVWSSDDCPNSLLARQLIVRAHKPVVYTFEWDGRRSTETCRTPGKVALSGGYWAEAALIGADVHRAYFDIT